MIRSSGCRNFTGAGAQAERSETMKQLILAAVSIGSLAAATPASAQGIPVFDSTSVRKHIDQIQRSEEHTSELQSLMRISYADFCTIKNKTITTSLPLLVRNPITAFL